MIRKVIQPLVSSVFAQSRATTSFSGKFVLEGGPYNCKMSFTTVFVTNGNLALVEDSFPGA